MHLRKGCLPQIKLKKSLKWLHAVQKAGNYRLVVNWKYNITRQNWCPRIANGDTYLKREKFSMHSWYLFLKNSHQAMFIDLHLKSNGVSCNSSIIRGWFWRTRPEPVAPAQQVLPYKTDRSGISCICYIFWVYQQVMGLKQIIELACN